MALLHLRKRDIGSHTEDHWLSERVRERSEGPDTTVQMPPPSLASFVTLHEFLNLCFSSQAIRAVSQNQPTRLYRHQPGNGSKEVFGEKNLPFKVVYT